MKKFNLTECALNHKQLVYFFIIVIFIAGIFSYQQLGRMDFPDFVIRQMVVSVAWPGANARQVEEQVTDKIEKKLQDTPGLDYLKSYSSPGQSIIYVVLKDTIAEKDVRPTWLEVRNMVNDIKDTFPQGVVGPYFNDRFDDVFGFIYALTGDGYTYEEMREKAQLIRQTLLGVPSVKKVELIGLQPEKIYIELESNKLAQLGIDPAYIVATVQQQNAMAPSGMLETSSDNVYLRVTGMFENIEDIRNLPLRANDHTFRLGDIAKIQRSYADPPEPKIYYNGEPAIGIALSMEKGGNILTLGNNLAKTIEQIKKDLPLGLEINTVADQHKVVAESINEFVKSLAEAVVIVLAVCFLSLGLRTGIAVALSIPLVICGVFACMNITGIDLHRISLGALIIALGLLVDDAIIAVEMMSVKLEQGWDRFNAASFAYTATAYPRLTGALVTCAGFLPVAFSKGSASELLRSIFMVVSMALLISWVVASTVTPLIGDKLIKVKPSTERHDIYDKKFYRLFKQLLTWCLCHPKLVLTITIACFAGSLFLMTMIKQEFFPPSIRPELIVDMTLPEGTSIQATDAEARKFAKSLDGHPDIINYTYYVGQGSPRFVLTADPVLPNTNFAQFVILTNDANARDELGKEVRTLLANEFTNVRGNVKVIETGPPDPYPVALRVSGDDQNQVRQIAKQVSDAMAANPDFRDINLDWNEKNKVMHLDIDQDKARMLGINSRNLAFNLQSQLSGAPIAEFREKDKTVSIVFRLDSQNLKGLSNLKDLNIHIGNGHFVPLDQIAKISYDAEEGLIWRRDLKPTMTVRANVAPGIMGNKATQQVYDNLQQLRDSLPPGYSIDIGGPLELSKKASQYLMGPVPAMIFIIITLLMLQLQSMSKMLLTLLTAPLGIIGVSLALLFTQRPMGFVVQLGVLALAGIIIRNSVILIDQIEQQINAGESTWDAIINAVVIRFRPIMLTAAAAILAMIPLASSIFWGPMAVAIAGGLFGATVLTLLVLPTMYAAWFKAKPNSHFQGDLTANGGQPVDLN